MTADFRVPPAGEQQETSSCFYLLSNLLSVPPAPLLLHLMHLPSARRRAATQRTSIVLAAPEPHDFHLSVAVQQSEEGQICLLAPKTMAAICSRLRPPVKYFPVGLLCLQIAPQNQKVTVSTRQTFPPRSCASPRRLSPNA